MLQESAGAILAKSFKAIGFVIVILYKFIIVPIVIPAVQHGIKHGWIYVPLGAIVALISHVFLYEALYPSTTLSHVLTIPLYILCIYGGVKLMQWKVRQNEQATTMYINPNAPEDLYEDDIYAVDTDDNYDL